MSGIERRGMSLSVRIALLFAAASLLVFSGTAYVLDRLLVERLTQRDESEVRSKVVQVRYLLGEMPALRDPVAARRAVEDAMVGHDGLAITVYRNNGRALFAVGDPMPLLAEPLRIGPDAVPETRTIHRVELQGTPWRIVAAAALTGDRPVGGLWLVLGRNSRLRAELLAEFRRQMWPVVLAGALASAILGALAVWRALRPLRSLGQWARRITVDRLGERFEPRPGPREMRELVDAFNAMLARLDDAVGRLARFSADLAHEFKTPLANMLMQSQVMMSQTRTVAEYQGLVASNIEEVERLSRMVDNMLFLARAENEGVMLRRTRFRLDEELERLVYYFQPLADEKGVRIELRAQGWLFADQFLYRRAIGNVLSNAIRHAAPGSTVAVEAGLREDGRIWTSVADEGDLLRPQELERIFERFYRGDPARHSSAGSTGLGLAIVRSIAELHRGRASARLDGDRVIVDVVLPSDPATSGGKTLIDERGGEAERPDPMEQAVLGMSSSRTRTDPLGDASP